jgi:phosphoribosyl 1,2-cyclic phosphate phosphodiesterase
MLFTILGSGGYIRTPRPCCMCELCKQARLNPAERRLGPSVYYNDSNLLIDTPEDIAEALNFSEIYGVQNIIYSHWHPDHVAGWRVTEQIRISMDFRSCSGNQNKVQIENPINLWIPEDLLKEIKKYFPPITYMEECGFVKINPISGSIKLNDTVITPIKMNDIPVYSYLMEKRGEKALVCMDHSKDIPLIKSLENVETLIMNLGYFDDDLPANHVRRQDTSFFDNIEVIKKLNPTKTIFTHIEELWGRNRAQYKKMEKQYDGKILFSYDGMKVNV